MLSFPDASGSTRSELSSPPDSGFHPASVLLRVLQSTTAKTSAPDTRRRTRRGCPDKMNPTQATKTPSYVTTDKHPKVGAAERRKRRTGTGGETHEATAARTVCAPSAEPFCSPVTHSVCPHTFHRRRQGAASQPRTPGASSSGAFRGRGDNALVAPVSPRRSPAAASPSPPARPLRSNATGLGRKLGLADRKSWIRFFFLSSPSEL